MDQDASLILISVQLFIVGDRLGNGPEPQLLWKRALLVP